MEFDIGNDRESRQRAELVHQRRRATALLVLMALLFVLARLLEPGFWTGLLEAAAEAALVGGLADWFAVTALFRHPLGLPIPHTAIIPRNKARIGEGLGRFVARNFLAPRPVIRKLRSLSLAERASQWLLEPGVAPMLAERMTASVPYLMDSLEDREVRDFIRRSLADQIERVELAPLLGRMLQMLVEAGHHQVLFDRALLAAEQGLLRNEERIFELVSDKSNWWVPSTVDRRIAARLIDGVADLLHELGESDHEVRRRFEQSVSDLIEGLKHSPKYRDRVNALKHQLLENPETQRYLGELWDRVRAAVARDLGREESQMRRVTAHAIRGSARTLLRDAAMRRRVDARLRRLIWAFVVPQRAAIGDFIAEVVGSWDTATVTERMELAVGRDLQFIRINGTLVGALVGSVIYLGVTFIG